VNLVNFGEGLDATVKSMPEAIPPTNLGKGEKMKKNRLFTVFMITALALMTAFTIQSTVATIRVAYASGASNQANPLAAVPLCEFPAVERVSIHRVYIEQMKSWVTYTDGGPSGVDGGLIELLSGSQDCSK
jgi:hypothetical protein